MTKFLKEPYARLVDSTPRIYLNFGDKQQLGREEITYASPCCIRDCVVTEVWPDVIVVKRIYEDFQTATHIIIPKLSILQICSGGMPDEPKDKIEWLDMIEEKT